MLKKISYKKWILIIIGIFLIWNLVWWVTTTVKYQKYVEAVPKDTTGLNITQEDGYTYFVKKPGYLRFIGNLSVSTNNKSASLIIWPKMIGGYKYGIRIQDDKQAYEVYLDKNMNPTNKFQKDKSIQNALEKNKAVIKTLFNKTESKFDLSN
ncbi:hypothetical protein [Priestia koreensis]|uniref:hypothetical protein n=1 Tax=Priestia koreensis TaxID=284581 RepID=UPI00203EDF79|nr:hypothetical protein [Priestia koreensis]MCM3006848.1 hypothetical protein [Priestia koreensis]